MLDLGQARSEVKFFVLYEVQHFPWSSHWVSDPPQCPAVGQEAFLTLDDIARSPHNLAKDKKMTLGPFRGPQSLEENKIQGTDKRIPGLLL